MKSKNLWGDLKNLKTIATPKKHLIEQADNLTTLTEGMLKGQVNRGQYFGNEFSYTIDIVAKFLNNYKKTILEVGHDINPYPLNIVDYINDKRYKCDNESDFLTILGEILSSPMVRNIIESLISHSQT